MKNFFPPDPFFYSKAGWHAANLVAMHSPFRMTALLIAGILASFQAASPEENAPLHEAGAESKSAPPLDEGGGQSGLLLRSGALLVGQIEYADSDFYYLRLPYEPPGALQRLPRRVVLRTYLQLHPRIAIVSTFNAEGDTTSQRWTVLEQTPEGLRVTQAENQDSVEPPGGSPPGSSTSTTDSESLIPWSRIRAIEYDLNDETDES